MTGAGYEEAYPSSLVHFMNIDNIHEMSASMSRLFRLVSSTFNLKMVQVEKRFKLKESQVERRFQVEEVSLFGCELKIEIQN